MVSKSGDRLPTFVFIHSLGCPEHMIRAPNDTQSCTTTVLRSKKHFMPTQLEYHTFGTHAGASSNDLKLHVHESMLQFQSELIAFLTHNSDIVGVIWGDSPKSMLPIYQELVSAGLRVWVFRYTSTLIQKEQPYIIFMLWTRKTIWCSFVSDFN